MDLFISEGMEAAQAVIAELKIELGRVMNAEVEISSPLMRLPEPQRRTHEEFFEL
ncbi:hypothetical protein NKI98_29430 [Mesorhizobium sp. M0222]|uniref:hypothetical protein n=1 Tax=Mesorhizobium sp. M0222 TaxID=2956921 RepID=UPI00333BA11C